MALPLIGQGGYVPPKIPAKVAKELDEAVLMSKAGQSAEATSIIQSLIGKYPDWIPPRQELSRIYYESGKKTEAIQQLEAAVKLDTASQFQQLYTLGKLYEETNEADRAIACYKAVVMKADPELALVQKAKDNCQAIKAKKALYTKSYEIHPVPFPKEINTDLHESLGRWSLDGSKMIFTRLVGGQEDIFIARQDSLSGNWIIEEFPFNSPQNEGAHAISQDGRYFIFTSCNRPDGLGSCDMYISVFKQGQWTKPVNMGVGFNGPSWDAQPCFDLDGTAIYFSSNREGGFGGKDIWYMYRLSSDSWSRPVNAGANINTPDNEESPLIHFDGRSIYFMRDGKDGLGGYDIYMSRRGLDDKWQKPENLGAPINSGSDEGALSLHPDGIHAILTQETASQRNDLFQIELPEKFRALPQQALTVTILDRFTGKPVGANMEIFRIDADHAVRASQWTDLQGCIITSIQRGVEYGIIANSPDYILYSVNLPADTTAARSMVIEMTPLVKAVNEPIALKNIFFASGSAELLPESEPELNKLLYTLKTHQSMTIEIRGHTDDVGEAMDNLKLSEARCRSVYEYIVGKGIAAHRISFRGYGETQPIAGNTTEEGRKKNRRTEFVILNQ